MVQIVEPSNAEQEGKSEQDQDKKEKIERLPVLEGICKYAADHVLLLGRPGSGKSTALARLLLQEAENARKALSDNDRLTKIPVLVELRYLSSEANESSVIEYNYDIAQTPLPPEDNPNPTTGNTYIFNDKVGQVVEKLTVQRDNIATQNNQKSAQDS